ncbi:metallophosphoesterase family protein [Thermodesulfobacteriota bacterium]
MPSVAEAESNACGDLLRVPGIRPAFEIVSVFLMATTFKDREKVLVGVISDTHGVLMPEVVQALKDVDLIIHAGDIGNPEVLDDLRQIAPVVAVRGNMDGGEWALKLPRTEIVEVGDALLYVLHDKFDLDLDPSASGIRAVISGHTHRPSAVEHGDVLFLNPGSSAYPRFHRPASLALLDVHDGTLKLKFVSIKI